MLVGMEYLSWIVRQFTEVGSGESSLAYTAWYAALEKPFFAPEAWVFGLVWSVVYPLIALALLWSLMLLFRKQVPPAFLGVFILNMALNLTFTPTLVTTRDNGLISLHIILVLGTLLWLVLAAWRRSRVIFFLLLPYVVWLSFATILQLSITALN
jgi:translocator protein